MKQNRHKKWFSLASGIVLLLLIMMGSGKLIAQTRTHDMGDFKLRMEANDAINTNDVDPTGEWPQANSMAGRLSWMAAGLFPVCQYRFLL